MTYDSCTIMSIKLFCGLLGQLEIHINYETGI